MSFKEKFKSWWTGEYKDSLPSVGGQAVMEGVMMKGPKGTAITVRKTDGTMTYVLKPGKKVGEKHKWHIVIRMKSRLFTTASKSLHELALTSFSGILSLHSSLTSC